MSKVERFSDCEPFCSMYEDHAYESQIIFPCSRTKNKVWVTSKTGTNWKYVICQKDFSTSIQSTRDWMWETRFCERMILSTPRTILPIETESIVTFILILTANATVRHPSYENLLCLVPLLLKHTSLSKALVAIPRLSNLSFISVILSPLESHFDQACARIPTIFFFDSKSWPK